MISPAQAAVLPPAVRRTDFQDAAAGISNRPFFTIFAPPLTTLGNNPFVTHINMNGTNDCIAYIDKLASIATNYSLGKVVISGNSGGYGNTNYYFDDTRPGYLSPKPWAANDAKTGVLNVNPAASVIYSNKPYGGTIADHITNATNLAGFLSWGVHGYNYDTNA